MTSKMSGRFSQNHALTGRGSRFGQFSAGFSLIELLVVIAIIGVLSSIILSSINGSRVRGREGRRIADISQLKLALEIYYDANRTYPTALSSLVAPGYIASIPKDPKSGLDYAYVGLKGASATTATCGSYHLGAKMELNTVGQSGSPFNDDKDGVAAGTYGTGLQDGVNCSGTTQTPSNSTWAGNADIPAVASGGTGNVFNGDDASLIYDMRP